jgi:hypothetical protein
MCSSVVGCGVLVVLLLDTGVLNARYCSMKKLICQSQYPVEYRGIVQYQYLHSKIKKYPLIRTLL